MCLVTNTSQRLPSSFRLWEFSRIRPVGNSPRDTKFPNDFCRQIQSIDQGDEVFVCVCMCVCGVDLHIVSKFQIPCRYLAARQCVVHVCVCVYVCVCPKRWCVQFRIFACVDVSGCRSTVDRISEHIQESIDTLIHLKLCMLVGLTATCLRCFRSGDHECELLSGGLRRLWDSAAPDGPLSGAAA